MTVIAFALGVLIHLMGTIADLSGRGLEVNLENILFPDSPMQWVRRIAFPLGFGLVAYFNVLGNEKRLLKEREQSKSLEDYSHTLEVSNQKLTTLNEALDGLVYTASHDLKAPVHNLQGLIHTLKMLEGKPGSEEIIQEVVARMEQSSDRLLRTIHNLLDISRVDQSLGEKQEMIDLKKMTGQILESLSQSIADKQAEIHIEFQEAPHLLFARQSMESILQNLISNSLKYSRPETRPEIIIKSWIKGGKLSLSIADNGQGIDMEKARGKLFQMFTRFTDKEEGSGIGLFIVKRSLETVGGSIEVESELGKGTRFTLTFPEKCTPVLVS